MTVGVGTAAPAAHPSIASAAQANVRRSAFANLCSGSGAPAIAEDEAVIAEAATCDEAMSVDFISLLLLEKSGKADLVRSSGAVALCRTSLRTTEQLV